MSGLAMHKLSIAVACVAGLMSVQASSAAVRPKQVEFHWIYVKQDATYGQFKNDTGECATFAKRPRYAGGIEYSPSSTVFLNCMQERGYTLAKDGWDTGVLWTKPYRRPGGPN